MEMKITLTGDKKVRLGLRKMSAETIDAVHEALVMGGNTVRNRMFRGMERTPKLGKAYKRGKRRIHRASLPGNYPAKDRGGLIGSLMMDEKHLLIEVGSSIGKLRRGKNKWGGAQYPIFLETGTKHMEARPWAEPSLMSSRGAILRSIERAIERATATAGGG